MGAIGIAILGVWLALVTGVVAGCTIKESSLHPEIQQAGSNSSPLPVGGLCKSLDVPPADVAQKPGYRQLDVSVINSTGWPVSGLTQKDFVLYSGSQNLAVAYFHQRKNDEPVAIALVVDTSGSMGTKLPIVRQPLRDFVSNLNRCDEVAVFAFNNQTYMLQPFSTDHEMTVERMKFYATGSSALYDATNIALQSLEGADYPNRKLVLISDGIDHGSATRESDVAARATKDGVPIYAVGIGDPNAPEKSGIAIGPVHIMPQPWEPLGQPIDVTSAGNLSIHTAYPAGLRGGAPPSAARVDATRLAELSAAAGGESFIVPARGEENGSSFETAIFAVGDNVARGYTIGTVVPPDATSSTVKVTVVNRPGLFVVARPMAATR